MSGPLVEVPYFRIECDRAIYPYLRPFGFDQIEVCLNGEERTNHATFSNEHVFLDFSYWPEHSPDYCLIIGVGFVEGRSVLIGSQIGLWYAMPPDKRKPMPFRNPDDLVRALEYLRDDILPTYAKPLWEDPQLLRQFINRFYSEQDATNEMKEVESKRRQAEAAFRAGNYSETVNLYRGFSPVDLTTTDQKRFEIARRKMSQS